MKNIRVFLSENFQFLEVEFSIYFNRRVFVNSQFYLLETSSIILLQFQITNKKTKTKKKKKNIRSAHGSSLICVLSQ